MRHLYSIVLYFLVPLVLFRLWWRGRKVPAYNKRILERFAYIKSPKQQPRIWLHAVSVGETMAAKPLLQALLQKFPDHAVLVTTSTPTGSAQLRKLFPERVEHFYFPYDLPNVIRRFLNRINPDILIVMETEIWPNLYHQCHQRKIPVVLANARLSERSLKGYKRISLLIKPVFKAISLLSPQSEADAKRFYQIGACKQQTMVCGNLKFEIKTAADIKETGDGLRHNIGNRLVWIAASTHKGEDEILLQVHAKVLESLPAALLILVPRHPERFQDVAELCNKAGMLTQRRSEAAVPNANTQVYLGDSMGELAAFYVASDIAFIGGSLVETGGHNPLEPAAEGIPVLMGEHVFNFSTIVKHMQDASAIRIVKTESELTQQLLYLFKHPEERSKLGNAAQKMVEKNQGATDCILREIQKLIS